MIDLLKALEINMVLIILLAGLGYVFREGIKNFFSEKILEKQKEYNQERDRKQQEFEKELSKQNADLQKEIQDALEKQRIEFQKELQAIDYKNDYYKKIIDKRIEAYEKIINVLLEWSACSYIGDKCHLYSIFISKSNSIDKIIKGLDIIHGNKFWVSHDLRMTLNIYSTFLSQIGSCLRNNNDNYAPLVDLINNKSLNEIERLLGCVFNFDEIKSNLNRNDKYLKNDKIQSLICKYNFDRKALNLSLSTFKQINGINNKIIEKCRLEFKEIYEIERFFEDNK